MEIYTKRGKKKKGEGGSKRERELERVREKEREGASVREWERKCEIMTQTDDLINSRTMT